MLAPQLGQVFPAGEDMGMRVAQSAREDGQGTLQQCCCLILTGHGCVEYGQICAASERSRRCQHRTVSL